MTTPSSTKKRYRLARRLLRSVEAFQGRHSLVGDAPVLDKDAFPWVEPLEDATADIRGELEHVLEHPEDIPAFHQMSPDQTRISKGDNWKTFVFYVFGKRVDENCQLCPATAQVLDALPSLQNAWFSILAPGYQIPAHRGPTRAILRAHLPLIVPDDWKNCWIRIHDQRYHWSYGQCIVFDDTYEHEVHNDTDQRRVVLFLDFDRPMDRIGKIVNRSLVGLFKGSKYVRDPLKNLDAWNRKRKS